MAKRQAGEQRFPDLEKGIYIGTIVSVEDVTEEINEKMAKKRPPKPKCDLILRIKVNIKGQEIENTIFGREPKPDGKGGTMYLFDDIAKALGVLDENNVYDWEDFVGKDARFLVFKDDKGYVRWYQRIVPVTASDGKIQETIDRFKADVANNYITVLGGKTKKHEAAESVIEDSDLPF